MTILLDIHPTHPQPRLIARAAKMLNAGAVLALPTDARYVLACQIGNSEGMLRIRNIRNLDERHLFSLLCNNFTQISEFAQMDNECFRFLKKLLPAPYTVILHGTKSLARGILQQKRRTIGIRLPQHVVLQALLKELNAPLIASTLELPDADATPHSAQNISTTLENKIEAVVNCGQTELEPTTVIDLTTTPYHAVRIGIAPLPW